MRKKSFVLPFVSFLSFAAFLSACSDDEDTLRIIDFESEPQYLAGPTSYGDNLYEAYEGDKFSQWDVAVAESGERFYCGLNAKNFYEGGIVLSQWNYRSNLPDKGEDWWYSPDNQCSVYNTDAKDGEKGKAGHNGSATFAVIYGRSDYNSNPEFHFSAGAAFRIRKMYICNSSYAYGVMTEGNKYGKDGEGVSLEKAKGWFKVLAYGYDVNGKETNGGKPVEKYLCDYREGANPRVDLGTTWQEWDLSALGSVNRVKFDFEGSDTGEWGLNTPSYLCIDDIFIE